MNFASDLPLERKLRYLLEGRYLDAGECRPKLSPRAYRVLAEWAWAKVGLSRADEPELLVEAHGACPRARFVTGCHGECTDGRTIAFRTKGELGRAALVLLHGFAHRILKVLWNFTHNETDAWLLTIALAVESRALWRLGPESYAAEIVTAPRWLLDLCYNWLRGHLGKRLQERVAATVVRLERAERVYRVRLAAYEVRG